MRTDDRRLGIEDRRGGIDESPMYIDRSEAGENVPGRKPRVDPVRNAEGGGCSIEYLRLKITFSPKTKCLIPKTYPD